MSLSVMPKVLLAQRRTWSMPSLTFELMSSSWLVSWDPTNDNMPMTRARVPMTVIPAARPRGMMRRRPRYAGWRSAARRRATRIGMTTSDSRPMR